MTKKCLSMYFLHVLHILYFFFLFTPYYTLRNIDLVQPLTLKRVKNPTLLLRFLQREGRWLGESIVGQSGV